MHTLRLILGSMALAWLAPSMVGAEPPAKLELTGSYEDAGTVVVAAPDQPPGVVSLHALLSLEFVPGLARLLQDQTSEVRLTHQDESLAVEVIGKEEDVIWRAHWKPGAGYALREGRVYLHLKPGRLGSDEFVLILSTLTSHRLLQVEVRRRKATFFGPVFEPMGTYLFHRAE